MKYNNKRVSVIIPVYNAEKHLYKTLNSIFRQTYGDIEIILVDDCSNDSSPEIIRKLMKNHSEITYYRQEQNAGAGIARNKALEMAKGRYVAFLDSDDEWLPDKLEKQIQLMEAADTPFCYTAIEMIDENDRRIKKKRNIKKQVDYKFLLSNTMVATSTVVVDRAYYGDFRMHNRRGGQDYATWLFLLRGGVTAYGINEALVRYRITAHSLSSNKINSIRQIWKIQTEEEHINKIQVFIHLFIWGINAIKKYYL